MHHLTAQLVLGLAFTLQGICSCFNILLWCLLVIREESSQQSANHCASPALALTYHPLLALPYKFKYVLVQQLLTEVELHFSPLGKHNPANEIQNKIQLQSLIMLKNTFILFKRSQEPTGTRSAVEGELLKPGKQEVFWGRTLGMVF